MLVKKMAKKKEEKKEVEVIEKEIKKDLPYSLVRMREENKGD